MKKLVGWVVVVGLAAGAVWAVTAWPHINEVETGQTPEYPDLQVRTLSASPAQVAEVLKRGLSSQPRWRVVGVGQGPGGTVITAVHQTRVFRFEDDVTIRIRRQGGATTVSVHSRSRIGEWDFGQNARNVREVLALLPPT
jgi:uncharacterized protein (DUF1499 family)